MCGDDGIAGVSLVQSAQDAVLSLFLINPIEKGGFDFDQTDIGWLFAGIGPIQIIFNHILSLRMVASFTSPLLYPLITRLYTYRGIYFASGLIYSVFLLLYPLISLSNQCNLSVTWFIILVSTVSCILIRLFNFTSVNVLINNSTYADYRGRVNGLGQVMAAIGRMIGPSLGSTLFAWSVSKDRPFPFNVGLTYYISFAGSAVGFVNDR